MVEFIKKFFTKHLTLKLLSLALALLVWFYIVDELKKGSVEELQILRKMLPAEGLISKKLIIKPVFVGTPYRGYTINRAQAVIVPEYCIVVGTRDVLGNVKHAYTMPIDVKQATRSFTLSVPLNPIAPGVYMEETLVQVTVPIEKETPS